ncbi:hypothetical protein MPTK2_1g13970 [Marchantia polymorpha subsp. ruderalis]
MYSLGCMIITWGSEVCCYYRRYCFDISGTVSQGGPSRLKYQRILLALNSLAMREHLNDQEYISTVMPHCDQLRSEVGFVRRESREETHLADHQHTWGQVEG